MPISKVKKKKLKKTAHPCIEEKKESKTTANKIATEKIVKTESETKQNQRIIHAHNDRIGG